MLKFLHASDIHLDSPLHKLDLYDGAPADEFRQATRRAFENLVQLAIAEKVAFALIAGDLYDGDWKDYNTGLYLVSQMIKLRDANIQVLIVAGNHDAASKITKTLRLPDNVYMFPSDKPSTIRMDEIKVALHGQSFSSPVVKTDLSKGYPAAIRGYYNIGLLHTCANGREGHEPYAPCSLAGLSNKGYDYWALGHVHQQEVLQADPVILFSGNPQGRHARETGPKGCFLVTVDDSGLSDFKFKPLDVVRWISVEFDAAGTESGYDVVKRFNLRLEELMEENPMIPLAARVVIVGETLAQSEIYSDLERWTNEIRSAALEVGKGRIWVEKIKFRLRLPKAEKSFDQTDGAIGELLNLFKELDADPNTRSELLSELADIEKKLPIELKSGTDGIRIDNPDWIGDLLDQVRPLLVKRLLRKGAAE